MFPIRFNRSIIAAVTVASLAMPGQLLAQTPDHQADSSAQFPNSRDLKGLTTAGSWLAARHAKVERDVGPLGDVAEEVQHALAAVRLHDGRLDVHDVRACLLRVSG